MRTVPLATVLLGAIAFALGCGDQPPTAPTVPAELVSSARASAACPAHADFVATDEASLLADLSAARPNQSIALRGVIELSTSIAYVTTDRVTITCATKGSGLRARPDARIPWLLVVFSKHVTVANLTLDGTYTTDGTLLSGEGSGLAEHTTFIGNSVSCNSALIAPCVLVDGQTYEPDGSAFGRTNGAVVTDNDIRSNGTMMGLVIQAMDSVMVARNRVTALSPSTDGITINASSIVTVSSNVVSGPWVTSLLLTAVDSSDVRGNQLSGATADAIDGFSVNGLRLTGNTVQCGDGCLFANVADSMVVADNQFTSAGSSFGIHLQGSTNGLHVEHNTVTTTAFDSDNFFGGIRVRDGYGVVIANNTVLGPWTNSIAVAGMSSSSVKDNRLQGALSYGIEERAGGCILGGGFCDSTNLFRGNQVSGAGSAGIFLQFTCRNTLIDNYLQGNSGNVGIVFDVTTGANSFRGDDDHGFLIIDNGAFDCNGDGMNDPNIIRTHDRAVSQSVVARAAAVTPPTDPVRTIRGVILR